MTSALIAPTGLVMASAQARMRYAPSTIMCLPLPHIVLPTCSQCCVLFLATAQKYMAEVCPLSCGTCTHACNDTDASCGSWAQAGECESNPDAMLRLCPTSCGLCTPECKDLKEECPGWGAAGECNENPEFMIRNCPVTCEACKSTCKDVQSDCPGWTADGECYKNPGFMYKECPNSCGMCSSLSLSCHVHPAETPAAPRSNGMRLRASIRPPLLQVSARVSSARTTMPRSALSGLRLANVLTIRLQ